MAIPPVDLAGAAAAAPQNAPNGAGFDAALQAAGGGEGQFVDQMVAGGAKIMGDMMMRLAGDMLAEGMADD